MQKGAVAGGHPPLPADDVELPEARHPGQRVAAALLPAPGPDPRHRADRLRQVDDPGLHDRPHQHRAAGPHRHDRGPDRVFLHAQKGPHQPARALRRHPVLRQRPPLGPARGPGRRPGRRDARPGDGRGDPARRRDRPPDLLHPPHELGPRDDLPDHRHLPAPVPDPGPDHAVDDAWRPSSPRPSCPRADGKGRVLAMEILIPNPAIRNLIRENKLHQIYRPCSSPRKNSGCRRSTSPWPTSISAARSPWTWPCASRPFPRS